MIGLLLLAGGGGRLGSCGLEAQECSGLRKRLQEGEEGEGEGAQGEGGTSTRVQDQGQEGWGRWG